MEIVLVIAGILLITVISVKGEVFEREKVRRSVSGESLSILKPNFWVMLPTWIGYLIGVLMILAIIGAFILKAYYSGNILIAFGLILIAATVVWAYRIHHGK